MRRHVVEIGSPEIKLAWPLAGVPLMKSNSKREQVLLPSSANL